MENMNNRNTEEELDTASEAKAGEDEAVEIPVEDGNLEEAENGGAEEDMEEAQQESDDSEPAEETAGNEDAEGSGNAKEGFFRKKKKDKKEEALKARIDELEDRVKRQMAEFENFRKRTDKEKAAMFETGAKSVIEKILPVVDNFERGLAAVPEEEKGSAFVEGMNKVYKQLLTELDNMGVKPIEAVGQEFDPNFHNAVMHIEDENFGENIVAEEFQKGYTYHDTVVRHSMVKVAN
ncbi:MAG TPA: nucleotide exchange factor GrpE [Candidatus Eisenbergiella intestinigallinarum]|uniref:Protein GrpE n=1 Tax=Candidatus Eisenbergiella intestinigallinarum TaxID=2838549 RepID=A0A9D2TS63_9FIRM|nr:nucleotide exchange factor GrpE [Candidatus Eisenbergiella intestinigallinarum]